MDVNKRRLYILGAVVDEFIRTGEPVGSKAVATILGNSVSSATIRNDMSALENEGFLQQPHASAGRVPTYIGYRLYINQLIKPSPIDQSEKEQIDKIISSNNLTANDIVENALDSLANITGCAVINKSDIPKFSVITRVEVVPAGRKLYALLIITSSGDVKNKICRLEFDITQEELDFFTTIINENITGLKVGEMSPVMLQNLAVALGSYIISLSPLLYAIYELSDEIANSNINIKGESNLLMYSDFNLNELIRFINSKDEIASILTDAFDGINIIFGKENDKFAITNSSLILSKYNVNGIEGSIGVIGPIRLDYAKVIPYIQYFSKSISENIGNLEKLGGNTKND